MKITTKIKLAGLLMVPVLAFGATLFAPLAQTSFAADPDLTLQGGADAAKGSDQTENLFGDGGIFSTITNVALFLIGAISVLMLIYGGIRYTISGGDSTAITNAKNTILYAVVGIVVAILAYAIVNFVLGSLIS